MRGQSVTVTTLVAVDAATAFEVFTREVDLWWKRAPRFRRGAMTLEPGVGGRFLDGEEEIARVREWEPARKLVLEWRGGPFGADQATEVEVRFEEEAGVEKTRVTVEHRGWEGVPKKYREAGLGGIAFRGLLGTYWAELLVALNSRITRR